MTYEMRRQYKLSWSPDMLDMRRMGGEEGREVIGRGERKAGFNWQRAIVMPD